MRATGHYTFKDYETWLKPRHASIAARFIAALPIRPLNALGRFVARYIVRKNPSMGLFELESWKG
jgi:hypothetical protein